MPESRSRLPHDEVYTRLAPSELHGVGVFAIRAIPRGAQLFTGDEGEMRWIRREQLGRLPAPIRKLYADFCVKKGPLLGCPTSFNNLTPAWYLNHSDTPNTAIDSDYNFFTLRRIRANEELTVDYSTYSTGGLLAATP